jgi:cell division septation protein DedD
MRGSFNDDALEPFHPKRDTELTMSYGMLLAIFFGLVLVCGLFFGLGYAVGRHRTAPSSPAAGVQPAGVDQASALSGSTPAKPSATTQQPSVAQHTPAQPSTDASGAASSTGTQMPASTAQSGSSAQAHPALPSSSNSAPSSSLMVQIASVANSEDADVLVAALRRHGYAVTARREPADGLIHVRIGPFNNRAEADRWRQKLLSDGYNASVQ